jgi:lipopolysaccharide heptosyltransferase II
VTGPRRILLAQTSFLGDVVLTTPLAQLLRDAFEGVEVWWLVRPDAADLISPLAGVERVLVFDKRGGGRGLAGVLAAARRVRQVGFDVAIGVQRSVRTAAVLALARVPLRIGFRGTLGGVLYHRTVEHAGAHARDRLLRLATGLDVVPPSQPASPELAVAVEAARSIGARLTARGVASEDRLLVLAPGSAWATKRWPAEHFAAAARALIPAEADAAVVVGAPGDRPLAHAVATSLAGRGAGLRVVDLTGTTTTGELAAVLARAHLVLANDSAAAHVGAALGRPVVALFGPTVPAQGFTPLGPLVRVLGRELACRPCSRHGGERCPIGTHECLIGLEVGLVVAAARELLRAGSSRPRNEASRLLR